MTHKTVFDKDFDIIEADKEFTYQQDLTALLDADQKAFDQNKLNEIVLWKVNRYAAFDDKLIALINSVRPTDTEIDLDKTRELLKLLLKTKGVQLAMASTILRFRNKFIYQIIDQRVYRIIYPEQTLKISSYPSETNIDKQIDLYIKYLKDLHSVCDNLKIPFEESDRILFMADKRVNKRHRLSNYGNSKS
ncbi:hypothetical protein [Leeuwenhoekiella sp. ZYFB001]|uniref:hypothetical protein n=1 Tax=Leeuwenhoekiella sp. ZYFB001 TaxID=2719912 RepID=UPI001431E54A|nr:hypothetical protein [Leeuwenhoekiella sp. ZYFB001]